MSGTLRSQFGETSEALFLTQGYVYDSSAQAEARFKGEEPGYQYSRFANPTVAMFEERMAAFEGAEAARATATGMAAVTLALMGQVTAGDHVVAAKALFGSCRYVVEDYLPRYGVASTLVDGTDLDQWRAAVRPNTKTFFLETPTNPTLEVIDIAAVAEIAHAAGATLVVDNVFATPLWQSPLALGADCVVYSATKHIDGQGRCLGGVILGSEKFIKDNIHILFRQTGPSMSPFNAWVMLKGLETLSVRVRRQTDTAAAVAVALAEHPKIYAADLSGPAGPSAGRQSSQKQMRGGSTLVAFEIDGGKKGAFRFQDALKLVRITNNLGDAKSLITHPATTTHQRLTPEQRAELGISDGLVRLSVGLEHPDDIIEDLLTALKRCDATDDFSAARYARRDGASRSGAWRLRRSRRPAAWRRSHSSSRSCAARRATRRLSNGMSLGLAPVAHHREALEQIDVGLLGGDGRSDPPCRRRRAWRSPSARIADRSGSRRRRLPCSRAMPSRSSDAVRRERMIAQHRIGADLPEHEIGLLGDHVARRSAPACRVLLRR